MGLEVVSAEYAQSKSTGSFLTKTYLTERGYGIMFEMIDPKSIKKTDVQDLQGKIIDVKEIKKIFSCDRNTIYNWRRKGLLRMVRIGGKLFASKQDIEKLIKRVTG